MRPRRLLLVVPLAWIACFSPSSAGPGGTANFDSGTGGFDSTAPDAEGTEAAADVSVEAAPIVDASIEAAVDVGVDAPPQPITVVVVSPAGPEGGVNVVWSDATGATVGSPVQTLGGTASTMATAVTAATVLFGTPSNPQAYTAMGLKPGDTVFVADRTSTPPVVSVTALPPSPHFDAGLSQDSLTIGSCYSYYPQATLPFILTLNNGGPPCIGLQVTGGSVAVALPVLLQAFDANLDVLGYSYTSQPLAALMANDAGLLDTALTGTWSTATTQQSVVVTQPADASFFSQVTYSEVFDGLLAPAVQSAVPSDAGAGTAAVVTTHVGIAQAVQAEAYVSTTGGMGGEGVAVVSVSPPPTAGGSITIDTSPVDSVAQFNTGMLTSVAPLAFGWTLVSGDLHQATGLIASVSWSQTVDGGGFVSGHWTIVSPGTAASSVTAPSIPASLAGYVPSTTSTSQLDQIAVVYGQTSMPSYSSMLPMASTVLSNPCYTATPAAPPLPGLGTAALVVFATGDGC
jgi:hypothetical protein